MIDCRSLYNPIKSDPYLETFISNLYPLITMTIERYKTKEYDNIDLYFGCSGGLHRSVHVADLIQHRLTRDINNVKIKRYK